MKRRFRSNRKKEQVQNTQRTLSLEQYTFNLLKEKKKGRKVSLKFLDFKSDQNRHNSTFYELSDKFS